LDCPAQGEAESGEAVLEREEAIKELEVTYTAISDAQIEDGERELVTAQVITGTQNETPDEALHT
jgi:hypothetical protein